MGIETARISRCHHLPRRRGSRPEEYPLGEGHLDPRTQPLYPRLRVEAHLLGLYPGHRVAHQFAGRGALRRQHSLSRQERLRLRFHRHRPHRGTERSAGHALRPQHHGRAGLHQDHIAPRQAGHQSQTELRQLQLVGSIGLDQPKDYRRPGHRRQCPLP